MGRHMSRHSSLPETPKSPEPTNEIKFRAMEKLHVPVPGLPRESPGESRLGLEIPTGITVTETRLDQFETYDDVVIDLASLYCNVSPRRTSKRANCSRYTNMLRPTPPRRHSGASRNNPLALLFLSTTGASGT